MKREAVERLVDKAGRDLEVTTAASENAADKEAFLGLFALLGSLAINVARIADSMEEANNG